MVKSDFFCKLELKDNELWGEKNKYMAKSMVAQNSSYFFRKVFEK